ncbi:MAG: hypothetical protein KDC16_02570 [Saprospiraceae bacterium]|nr:hypothetical protein [Saprospiraceae bacterium]MCB9327783.1 hypothetical protein [Lewinellaceae bacterium]HPK09532.1 hypothetical protein [Saprospiraceae bacterium]
MEATLINGLKLLGVGMSMVFLILAIIVLVGKFLILATNKFSSSIVTSPEVKDTGDDEKLKKHIAIVTAVASQVACNDAIIKSINVKRK